MGKSMAMDEPHMCGGLNRLDDPASRPCSGDKVLPVRALLATQRAVNMSADCLESAS